MSYEEDIDLVEDLKESIRNVINNYAQGHDFPEELVIGSLTALAHEISLDTVQFMLEEEEGEEDD